MENSYFGTARLRESWEIVILEQRDSESLGDRYSGTLPGAFAKDRACARRVLRIVISGQQDSESLGK